MRILALTPIENEFNSLTETLEQLGLESCEVSAGRLSCRSYLEGDLIVAPGGLGKAQFGIQTQYAIDMLPDREAKDSPFDVHFGIVASGDEGIVDPRRASELRENTGAIAVAWEGAGGARAAAFSNLPFLELRGISDGAGAEAPAEFELNLPHTMHNVAVIVLSLAQLRPPAS